MKQQIKGKRFLAALLCVVMLFSEIPISVKATEENTSVAGSFYLAAVTETEVVIEPVEVDYLSTQTTLRQVLEENDTYQFTFSGDFVSTIETVDAGWSAFVDNGTYNLAMAPSAIKVLGFTTAVLGESEEEIQENAGALSKLIIVMAQYNTMTGNIKNYAPATEAYFMGAKALQQGDGKAAATAAQNLTQAITDYEAYINGELCTITVEAFQGEEQLTNPSITFIDKSGNKTENDLDSSVKVVAGEYDYIISDGAYNRVEGTINVTETDKLQVALPKGEWFQQVQVKDKEKAELETRFNGSAHEIEVLAEDTTGEDDLYLYVEQGEVPVSSKTKLKACYIGTDGEDKSEKSNSWNSNSNKLSKCLEEGMEGKTVRLEACYETTNYIQIQSYYIKFKRVPTLKNLVVREGSTAGMSVLSNFSSKETTYNLTTGAEKLYVEAEANGIEGYTITGNEVIEVGTDGFVERTVTVSHKNGESREYHLNITKGELVEVTLSTPKETTVEVQNENGETVPPIGENTYHLISGQKYIYIATKEKYFHTTEEFSATTDCVVAVAEPEVADVLENFALYDSPSASIRELYESDAEFSSKIHNYTYTITDENSLAAAQATLREDYTAMACYNKQSTVAGQHGVSCQVELEEKVDSTQKAVTLKQLIGACGYNQSLAIRVSKEKEGITWYQDYEIALVRSLHLKDLKVEVEEKETCLLNENDEVITFDSERSDYYVAVSKETEAITLKGEFVNEKATTDICGGYSVEISGQSYSSLENIVIPLTEEEQIIEIKVKHLNEQSLPCSYRIHVKKQEAVEVSFETTPKDAIVFVVHQKTNSRVYATENGSYLLYPNDTYIYRVTCNGYVAKQVTDYQTPTEKETIKVTLEKAPENETIDASLIGQWSSFRNTPDNNCVTDVKTPIESENAALYWATKLGTGYGGKATGCPIILDGYLYTYAGKNIYKLDTVNGQIVATGTMVEASSYAINPPTYAEGMIFVGLKDGRIQAFNAKTLESLWVYQDEIGGQPNCPITYRDGYIYTGFWKGESQEANYVCVSVTDENPLEQTEEKLSSWTYTSMGGFYWAGAYVCDEYMLVGTDDGFSGYTTGYGHVISLDPKSGKILGDIQLPFVGDVRSNITLYNGKFYFTSKGGYFYELAVEEDGSLQEESLRYIKLENGATNASNPAMSTSTPTIYNGRAYVGVAGISQFGAYSGHSITVLDLEQWEIAYSVPTQGYPQTSGLLTTAYKENTKKVYIYFFDNYTPGKLRIISDKPGQTKATEITVEEYSQGGETKSCEAAKVLFTPSGEHAQYALCSPIVDEYGTIYFKNDSAYLMAVGSTIEKIEVVTKPKKINYQVGEKFDASGMKVVATYSNGMTRDVTEYITYSQEPLTKEDEDIILQFDYILYQDKDKTAGVDCAKPMTSVQITVGNSSQATKKTATAKLSTSQYTYDGKVKKPKVIVKNSQGELLKKDIDYTLSYEKGRKNVGRYKVEVTYKGNYTGSKALYFYINPSGTFIRKLSAGKKKLTVTYKKKTTQVTGYEIQYATNKKFKKAVTVKVTSNSKSKKSIYRLKSKTKYYVRIRTYKKVKIAGKSKKLYSVWSSAKAVTIK